MYVKIISCFYYLAIAAENALAISILAIIQTEVYTYVIYYFIILFYESI